jgi:hypothetical protein
MFSELSREPSSPKFLSSPGSQQFHCRKIFSSDGREETQNILFRWWVNTRTPESNPLKYLQLKNKYEFPDLIERFSIKMALMASVPVHSVQHFNGDQHRQGHGHGMRVVENVTVQAFEFVATSQARHVMGLRTWDTRNNEKKNLVWGEKKKHTEKKGFSSL